MQIPPFLAQFVPLRKVLGQELVQVHMFRVFERRPLRLRPGRQFVRREHVLAHELERDDLARLEDDVLFRRGPQRARQAEFGRQAGDEVVQILRPPHIDLDDGKVVCAIKRHFAKVFATQAIAEVEQAAVTREALLPKVPRLLEGKLPGPFWSSIHRRIVLEGPFEYLR